jgi:tellurite resistance protein TerC
VETSVGFEVVTLIVLSGVLIFDVVRSFRNPKIIAPKSAAIWLAFYATLAVVFGVVVWTQYGSGPGGEFYSGWLTEYSLSVDNIFVFILIMSNFKVPKHLQKKALGVGIIVALILRGIFILIGAQIVENFSPIFYVFGIFLIYTAVKMLVDNESDEQWHENRLIQFFHRILPLSKDYHDDKLRVIDKTSGKTLWTPLLLVFLSLGVTDLLFAFDSIPAIFGLTKDPFIVFTANIFALMGLQQLYFLLGDLVTKLKFLPLGISIVLAFIGVKLICEALHESGFSWAPEFNTFVSLFVIFITISFTSAASVMKIKRDERLAKLRAGDQ